VVATGQQIGAGWSPALSVLKALAALAEAKRLGLQAVFWMADEDHDQLEVASVVGLDGLRLRRHGFRFEAPSGTATGWLPWNDRHQSEAESLWGPLPTPLEPTLRGHFQALGRALWDRGIQPFSPTNPALRASIQDELERWRGLGLEADLRRQAALLAGEGAGSPLDPEKQHAWFSLDPGTGQRIPIDAAVPCPKGCWLSPGAALRPLMQSLLLPVRAVVLGPSERAYWRLCEPLWERVGLTAPRIIARPTAYVRPRNARVDAAQLDSLREGRWEAFSEGFVGPSDLAQVPPEDPLWGEALNQRAAAEWARYRHRLLRLDVRLRRDRASESLGMEAERLRQIIFPLGKPQERVLPGWLWLKDPALLDRLERAMESGAAVNLVEES
jgi:hypothetical protein